MGLWRNKIVKPVFVLTALFLTGAVSACSVNPATGEDTFTAFMSPAQEKQVGAEEHPKILEQFGGTYDAKSLDDYIAKIGARLVAVSETPNNKFTFTVLNSPVVNAFALPGGYVYVTRGLLALASNEAEIAGVLAHEIGHVVARHSAQRYSRGVLTQLGAGVLGAALGSGASDIANYGANVYMKSFSREHEFEADKLGVRYLARAGYDPEAMATFLTKLRAHSRLQAELAGRSPDDIDQFDIMATHPRTVARIEQAKAEANVDIAPNPELDKVRYMTAIDGIIYGDGPENGYVRGRKFIHVPLDFYFEVPDGFVLRNQPDSVVATDTNEAVILFEGAPKARGMDLKRYLAGMFGGKITLTGIDKIDINNQDAATGSADVTMKSGTKARLRVVAIRHKDAVYQFLFIIPLDRVDSYNVALRRTTYSFRSLTPSEKRDYKPLHIKVRAVNPEYTLSTFVKDMAVSQRPEETFAVLNGLAEGEMPPKGSLVKVVSDHK
jgi:predicted Zn-dependent protease